MGILLLVSGFWVHQIGVQEFCFPASLCCSGDCPICREFLFLFPVGWVILGRESLLLPLFCDLWIEPGFGISRGCTCWELEIAGCSDQGVD